MLVRASLFSGSRRASTSPSGSASKASSVGANTVNGPSPESVSTRSAAVTAATRVSKSGLPAATSTIVPGSSMGASDMVSDIDSDGAMLALVVSAVLASGVISSLAPAQPDRNRRAATLPAAAILIFMVTPQVV